jgi:hypothetical protein
MPDLDSLPAVSRLKTPRHRRFVLEYLATNLQGAEAARRAGYSAKSARVQASQLLADPNIALAVQEGYQALMQEVARRSRTAVLDAQSVFQRDSQIAAFDPADVVEWDDDQTLRVKPLKDIPLTARQCISSIRETRQGMVVSFVNPHPSVERLARYNGMMGGFSPVESSVRMGDQSDAEKAQRAAEWLESIAARLGTDSVSEIVGKLRKPPETN